MTLVDWTILCLILSIVGNIFCAWYIRRLLIRMLFVSQNLTDLVDVLGIYRNHLEKIYNLEMFHGDETIKFLIQHTKSLLDILDDYSDIYLMTEPMVLDELDEDEELYVQETRTEKNLPETDVFYGGTRSSDS
jgi:hypothetical protein